MIVNHFWEKFAGVDWNLELSVSFFWVRVLELFCSFTPCIMNEDTVNQMELRSPKVDLSVNPLSWFKLSALGLIIVTIPNSSPIAITAPEQTHNIHKCHFWKEEEKT